MVDIFISYRSNDLGFGAGVCYEYMLDRFGADRVFRDRLSIQPGEQYPEAIRQALEEASVLLVLIGPAWLEKKGSKRPIDDKRDWVRREIRRAIERGIEIVPVLVDTARLPLRAELPDDISELAQRQCATIDHLHPQEGLKHLADRLVAKFPGLNRGVLVGRFEGHVAPRSVALSGDCKRIAVVGGTLRRDIQVYEVDVSGDAPIHTHRQSLYAAYLGTHLALDESGRLLVTTTRQSAYVYEADGSSRKKFPCRGSDVVSVAIDPRRQDSLHRDKTISIR
jgi:hypothetical protein